VVEMGANGVDVHVRRLGAIPIGLSTGKRGRSRSPQPARLSIQTPSALPPGAADAAHVGKRIVRSHDVGTHSVTRVPRPGFDHTSTVPSTSAMRPERDCRSPKPGTTISRSNPAP
jgi:hypothetical protein